MTSKLETLLKTQGYVICAEGYLFEMERRGYLQAGAFVPEVVLEHPEVVEQLHREFVRAGSDIVEAFTYYAHREKLRLVGREEDLEKINRKALQIAAKVASETGTILAGNICNTNLYQADGSADKEINAMFDEQLTWAVEAGADFIIGETFSFLGEAILALEAIKKTGLPAVITLAIHRDGLTREGETPEFACAVLEEAGAFIVGLNCLRGPDSMYPLLSKIRSSCCCPIAALPVPYRTPSSEPTFGSLVDKEEHAHPVDQHSFPVHLDPFTCTRFEIATFGAKAKALGVSYFGVCCGAGPHHIRALAEVLGKKTEASLYSADMSKHYALGSESSLKSNNLQFQTKL